jgi:hypothetical protein
MRASAFFAAIVLATAASGNEAIEDALGGPFTTCTGAIAWTENDNGAKRMEPMRLAVRDAEDAAAIGLFLSEDDFTSDNVWACMDGICSAHATVRGAVTTNVLRLRRGADLANGEVLYEMQAVFMVVNARETQVQVDGAQGVGSFICERALSKGLVSMEQ